MITFDEIQVGKLYYIDSFDDEPCVKHSKEIIFILDTYIVDDDPCIRYLSGTKEYTSYCHFTTCFDITLCD